MALPFKLNPESPQPPADDPFLEFAPERPGPRSKATVQEPLFRPAPPEFQSDRLGLQESDPSLGLGRPRRTAAISPAFAFGLGVAGLVTATVAYYQLAHVLSTRTATPQAEGASAPAATAAPGTTPPSSSPAQPPAPSPSPVAEQPVEPPAPAGTGRVDVVSNPPGAHVRLNGEARGVTPVILTGLTAGQHTIVVSRGSFSATRTVELGPGGATAVSVAIPYSVARTMPQPRMPNQQLLSRAGAATAASGWLTFDLPIDLLVYLDGRLLGNTRDGRVALPAGTRNVVLANTTYEYREVVSLTVTADVVTRADVSLPTGYLSLNALPWADVWVDGKAMGTTPLANLSLPIGVHEVLWRHPTLGDRRQLVLVKAKTPQRAGVDFTR